MPNTNGALFSPIIIADLFLQPLPRWPLEQLFEQTVKRLKHNHPAVLERLQILADTRFLICPIDVSYSVQIDVIGGNVEVALMSNKELYPEGAAPDVKITGTLYSLAALLDGEADGDALFFSRDLIVEGDTEALLVLRNALDSDDINLKEEILMALGPFHGVARKAADLGLRLFASVADNMTRVKDALTSDLMIQCEVLTAENQDQLGKLETLEKTVTRQAKFIEKLRRPDPS